MKYFGFLPMTLKSLLHFSLIYFTFEHEKFNVMNKFTYCMLDIPNS